MSHPPLNREEYIEQAYFFCNYHKRLVEGMPSQEILVTLKEEILATTNLPMAIEFLTAEVLHVGRMSEGMGRLGHYFTPFQTFVMKQAEEDRSKFDQTIALKILERQADYLSKSPTAAGLFLFQFECIARNRLGYDEGLMAVAEDSLFDEQWQNWIRKMRHQIGMTDFAEMLYRQSQFFLADQKVHQRRTQQMIKTEADKPESTFLFGLPEGRIAKANRGKDPLYMFAALQRQLGYPTVPRPKQKSNEPLFHPAVEQRFHRLEQRLKIMENEAKGTFDITEFYKESEDEEGQKKF